MNTGFLNAIAILGTLATVLGFAYAIVSNRRADRRKLLAFDVTLPLALASVMPDRTQYRLSITYQKEGEAPVSVKGAYLRFIQIGNFGKEPIRSGDIASSDPLCLEIHGGKVLDLAVASQSRSVIQFQVGPIETRDQDISTAPVTFDFLDHLDGAIVRITTDSPRARIDLHGTVIGMPKGILPYSQLSSNRTTNVIGCSLAIILELAAIAATLYVFYTATGSWSLLWLFLLPFIALFLPGAIIAIAYSTIWPKGPTWPAKLKPPAWFLAYSELDARVFYRRDYPEYAAMRESLLRELDHDEELPGLNHSGT